MFRVSGFLGADGVVFQERDQRLQRARLIEGSGFRVQDIGCRVTIESRESQTTESRERVRTPESHSERFRARESEKDRESERETARHEDRE